MPLERDSLKRDSHWSSRGGNKEVPIGLGEMKFLGGMVPLGEADKYHLDALEIKFLEERVSCRGGFCRENVRLLVLARVPREGSQHQSTLVRCHAR